jgi:hypothetical protein
LIERRRIVLPHPRRQQSLFPSAGRGFVPLQLTQRFTNAGLPAPAKIGQHALVPH